MARPKTYKIELTDSQLCELRTAIHKNKTSKTIRCRCQIVLELDEAYDKNCPVVCMDDISRQPLESVCHNMQRTENYQIGLGRFIELSGKSQEYLNRVMKKYYGMTTTAYLNAIRLEQAAFLLRTTDESVLNIMLECGFNNVSYFNQRFKEGYGITPTRYRQFNRLAVNPV